MGGVDTAPEMERMTFVSVVPAVSGRKKLKNRSFLVAPSTAADSRTSLEIFIIAI